MRAHRRMDVYIIHCCTWYITGCFLFFGCSAAATPQRAGGVLLIFNIIEVLFVICNNNFL